METGGHLDFSQRFPSKTIGGKNWIQKLLEVVKTPNKSNQNPKPNDQVRGDLWRVNNHLVCFPRKSEKMSSSTAKAPVKEQGDLLTVVCQCLLNLLTKRRRTRKRRRRSCGNGETRWKWTIHLFVHTARGKRHWFQSVWIATFTFEKKAENFRVRELVKKIESYLHREALQADFQQNNVDNPFSDDSKAMIHEMGTAELFELCETIPKVQCSECVLYWSPGVIYRTCGHLLVESECSQNFNKWWLDALSIQLYIIKKERPEEKCIEMDKLALEDHSYRLSREEYLRYQKHWYLTLNKSAKNAPMRLRSDFRAAVTIMNHLHRESGEERPEPIHFQQYHRWDPSSSSSSWWNWDTSRSWRRSWEQFIFKLSVAVGFVCSWQHSAATDGRCQRYTSHVTFSLTPCACWKMRDTTSAQVLVRVIPSMCHASWVIVCSLLFPHLVPFRGFLLSLLLLPEPGLLFLPLPCGLHRGKIPLALLQWRSLACSFNNLCLIWG